MRYLMDIYTGSVATEEEWREDFASMTSEEWGCESFEGAELVEVVPDSEGGWVEA